MAELTFKSAGVATREIDLSGPTTVKPQGIPAGVIGMALKGRAFVPITFATYQDFVAEFGTSDGEKFGPLAVYEWMKNSRAGTYVRTLGVGDGNQRTGNEPNVNSVTNAGFSVGSQQPQETLGGLLGDNAFAGPQAGIPASAATADIELTVAAAPFDIADGDHLILRDFNNVNSVTVRFGATGMNNVNGQVLDMNIGTAVEAELRLELSDWSANNDMDPTYNGFPLVVRDAIHNQTVIINDGQGNEYVLEWDNTLNCNASTATHIGCLDIDDTSGDLIADFGDNTEAGFNNVNMHHNMLGAMLQSISLLGGGGAFNIVPAATQGGAGTEWGGFNSSRTIQAATPGAYPDADSMEIHGGFYADLTHGRAAAAANSHLNVWTNPGPGSTDMEFDNGIDAVANSTDLRDNIISLLQNGDAYGNVAPTLDTSVVATTQNSNPTMRFTQNTAETGGNTIIDHLDSAAAAITNAANQAAILIENEDVLFQGDFTGGVDAITSFVPALGRTYFLGCLTEETADSDYYSDAGISVGDEILGNRLIGWQAAGGTANTGQAAPLLRAVLLAPSGVLLSLSSSMYQAGNAAGPGVSDVGNNQPSSEARRQFGIAPATDDGGYMVGTVNRSNGGQQFVMLLNGHINTPDHPNILTASFDPVAPDYLRNIFNTDPGCTEKAGHCLYTSWDVHTNHGVAGGTGIIAADFLENGTYGVHEAADMVNLVEAAFLVTGSLERNAGLASIPNPECFEDRYRTAYSPWITSQKFGGQIKNLFKIHALDDGTAGCCNFKFSIANIAASSNESSDFGKFDLFVRAMEDDDDNVVALEKFYGLNLDPTSDRYAARVIGDQWTYYDFDKPDGAQKLVIEGIHPNNSKYIRIQMAGEVDRNTIDDSALPVGFRGHDHLVTSGSVTEVSLAGLASGDEAHTWVADAILSSPQFERSVQGNGTDDLWLGDPLSEIHQVPVPMRNDITTGVVPRRKTSSNLYWGVQFQVNDDPNEPNRSKVFDKTIYGFTKYFPNFNTGDMSLSVGDNAGATDDSVTGLDSVLDSDRFNNNSFSLEKVEVQGVNNDAGGLDNKKWNDAVYRRAGVASGDAHADGLSTGRLFGGAHFQDDFSSLGARKYRKFSCFLQGGFNGLNILDVDQSKMSNLACRREMAQPVQQGGVDGPTVASYRKALDVMAEKADVDIKLLAIPGLRDPSVSEYAIDTCEDRFDAMLIMDVRERDENNEVVENKLTQKISVSNTVEDLLARNLDTSFAAAYFPDCVVPDPFTRTNVLCPPSVAVLGAFALNDAVAHPWFAPAGFTRGALARVVESQVKLNRANLDSLYEADINPLSAFPHTPGVVVWGQKTLQAAKSALDRVNVRRLLIEIRRQVKRVGNTLLFEPNRAETLARFSNAVNPILQRIQQQQGLDKFKVVIDTTTTTQADVENNTVRGKIFLQPTRTVEFISLDFVVTNAGMEV